MKRCRVLTRQLQELLHECSIEDLAVQRVARVDVRREPTQIHGAVVMRRTLRLHAELMRLRAYAELVRLLRIDGVADAVGSALAAQGARQYAVELSRRRR